MDSEIVIHTKHMIDESLTMQSGFDRSYIELTLLDLPNEIYQRKIDFLKKKIDPFIRDEVCYLKDKEDHEVEGALLQDYFKKDLEYNGCELIITIIGLKQGSIYSIKMILKSFNEDTIDMQVTLGMLQHARLNAESEIRHLEPDVFRHILTHGRWVHPAPQIYHTKDLKVMDAILTHIFTSEIFRIDFEFESMAKQRRGFRKFFQFQLSNIDLLNRLYDHVDRVMSDRITTRSRAFYTIDKRVTRTLSMRLGDYPSENLCSISFDSNPPAITAELTREGHGNVKDIINLVNDESFSVFLSKLH